jgi:hypothetical protein
MSSPIARTLGALALAAALATSSTAAFAATTSGDPSFYLTKKRTTTLVGLSPEVRATALRQARSTPHGIKLAAEGGTPQGMPDNELDAICNGDWFITWDEDAKGNPVMGSFNLHCAGETYSLP